jgi:dimethylamine/trimethylamine dehydrogenase
MVEAVTSGQLDLIGAARPSIADPFLPQKIEEGRVDDIRECIGCNICLAHVWGLGSRLVCTQNATVGEEYRRGWHPERFETAANANKSVLVVGAGPAGLECARVLAERGMSAVHLVDAEDALGGAMRWIPNLPGLGEWSRVVSYRAVQLRKLPNVEVILNAELTFEDVLAYGADLVVLATGSQWAIDGLNGVTHAPIPGADGVRDDVLTPESIMSGGAEVPGDDIVIYDCDGYFMAVSLAEKLASGHRRVRLVTPAAEPAAFMQHTSEARYMLERLYNLDVIIEPRHVLTEVGTDEVHAIHVYRHDDLVTWPADAVVLVTQRKSVDHLYRAMEADPDSVAAEEISGVYRVGDCVVPRLIVDAVFDGHRLAREIDTPDPRTHLPYLREHAIWNSQDPDKHVVQ